MDPSRRRFKAWAAETGHWVVEPTAQAGERPPGSVAGEVAAEHWALRDTGAILGQTVLAEGTEDTRSQRVTARDSFPIRALAYQPGT